MRVLSTIIIACFAAHASCAGVTAADVLSRSGVRGGLVVVVGCDDSAFMLELGRRSGYVVHGIDTDTAAVARAAAAVREAGLYGKVAVAPWGGGPLPYIDGLVNLLVDPDGTCTSTEIDRVLAPRGLALVAGRRVGPKPVPAAVDDWSHHLYDASGVATSADTRVAQPRSMQWKAGPEYSRSHENMASVSAVVGSAGRVFAIMDEGPAASIYLPARWAVTARDAFSGVLLWRVPIDEWHARLFPLKSGPQQLPRRLVATPDSVFVTLGIDAPVTRLDAATGQVLNTYEPTAHAEEIIHIGGMLVAVVNEVSAAAPYRGKVPKSRSGLQIEERTVNLTGNRSVVCLNPATGKQLWRTAPAGVVSLTLTAADGKVVFVTGKDLVCLELRTGKQVWAEAIASNAVKSRNTQAPVVLMHNGSVFLAHGRRLTARAMESGKQLWSAPCAAGGYRVPTSLFMLDGLIWDVDSGGEPYRPGADLAKVNRHYVGYDPRTGKEERRIPVTGDHGYAIMHHRCHVPRAAGDCIITSFPGIELFDVKTGSVTHDSWIRGACLYGFMPANGLIYTPPHPCACYTQGKLTGFWAVAGARSRRAAGTERLLRGPAYGTAPGVSAGADDWATYRGSAARAGVTSVAVKDGLEELWATNVAPGISQCVVANGRLYTAGADHTVYALDAKTGAEQWRHTAGGGVDSPPTLHHGRVLFGARDGTVTCLTADTGALVWRLRIAPLDQRCVAYNQVESVWPVHGSVLVQDGVAWACAGRSSYLDGGLHVLRFDPVTGDVLSSSVINSLQDGDEQKPITHTIYARLDMEGAKNDVLSCDGTHVFMRHWAFDLNGGNVPRNIDHLFAPTGFLDASWFRRTYWIYGQIYVSGAQGWARTGNQRPTGRFLCIDADRVYGFGRNTYPPSPGNRHQMYLEGEKEMFFAATKAPTDAAALAAEATGKRRSGKKKGGAAAKIVPVWTTPGDLQVRGMALAGTGPDKRLVVVGAKGDWIMSQAAFEGKEGSVLRIISPVDGATVSEQPIPGLPVYDGLSIARGRVYVSLADGRVLCMGAPL